MNRSSVRALCVCVCVCVCLCVCVCVCVNTVEPEARGNEVEGNDGVGVEGGHKLRPLGTLLGDHEGDRDQEREDHPVKICGSVNLGLSEVRDQVFLSPAFMPDDPG